MIRRALGKYAQCLAAGCELSINRAAFKSASGAVALRVELNGTGGGTEVAVIARFAHRTRFPERTKLAANTQELLIEVLPER